jgi:lipoprotein-anchoring transpeptidase ErfK/SrfK
MVVFQENGREANLALVSTGRPPYFSTPRGEFRVQYRLRNPMSSTYLVRMPYWVCIEPSGAYGFHQANGIAESRLGEPLSHGCIRLGRFTAKWVYSWMPNGAGVTIH